MKSSLRFAVLLGVAVLLGGCESGAGDVGAASVDSLTLRPGYVVDSIFPMEEMLRRFRADLGPTPSKLESAPTSREALVRDFVRALTTHDTAALGRLHLSRAEFAWLYFPSSRFASPPYELPPDILWLQMTGESNKAIARALRLLARGGTYHGYSCAPLPDVEGENRLWRDCAVRWRDAAGGDLRLRLFGSILERGGRFKFVTYANGL